jgi:hypothetical protein
MPGHYAIDIVQGETWNPTWTYKINGSAVNNTGYSARLQVRLSAASPGDPLLELLSTGGSPKITLGGVAGWIKPLLTASETAALLFRRAVYELELIAPSGSVKDLLEGPFRIRPEVTR